MTSRLSAFMRWSGNGGRGSWPMWRLHKQAAPPGDPPWLAQLDRAGIPRMLRYPSTNLARMLEQTADRFGRCAAVIYGDEQWSYQELLTRVNRFAAGLAGLGVRRGDRVLMTLPNCPEFIVSFFAVQKLGAVVVNAGPLIGPDHLETIVELTRPRVMIGLDLQNLLLSHAARNSSVEHRVRVSLEAYQPLLTRVGYRYKLWHSHRDPDDRSVEIAFKRLLDHAPALPPTVAPDPDDLAVLQPTGGTTGSPKVAQLSHRNLICNATQLAVWIPIPQGQGSVLAVLPMFHVFGLTCCLIAGVLCGTTIIPLTRFRVREVLDTIRRHRPSIFPLVPSICEAMSDELEKKIEAQGAEASASCSNGARHYALEGLDFCISGAAPLPPAAGGRFQRLTGVPIVEGYGLTEASPVTHGNLRRSPRAGTIGLPLPDTRVSRCRCGRPDARARAAAGRRAPGSAGLRSCPATITTPRKPPRRWSRTNTAPSGSALATLSNTTKRAIST